MRKRQREDLGLIRQFGLDSEEVTKRRKEYGENKLEEGKRESLVVKFLKQFNDFMIIVLIFAAIFSGVMAYIERTGDYLDSVIIIFIVVLNAIFGLVQESKAEKSLEALKKMSAPTAKVIRGGEILTISREELVPGDYIYIETGSFVPADSRLVKSFNLKVEESALTGETVPINKDANAILAENIPTGDKINMVFEATVVVHGHAEAVVTEIGMSTKVGKIAKMIIAGDAPETPLQRKLGELGKKLGLAALVICFLVFIIGVSRQIPAAEMLMTSVGLAVAAIPEGLPAIVTILLAIGVTKMARKKAIIRKLPAVETLGSSSVICSDKTGTLTQNKMQVVEIEVGGRNLEFGKIDANAPDNVRNLFRLAAMCTDSKISPNDGLTVTRRSNRKGDSNGSVRNWREQK